MINSHWTDSCHCIKQDSVKAKKKDIKYNEQDVMDMIFIGPDADAISSTRKGKIIHTILLLNTLIIQYVCIESIYFLNKQSLKLTLRMRMSLIRTMTRAMRN